MKTLSAAIIILLSWVIAAVAIWGGVMLVRAIFALGGIQ